MPVTIPTHLPAVKILGGENVFVMTEERARTQDIRPLDIGIINLMPTKISTETQLLRLLSNSPLQVEVTLVKMGAHVSKTTSREHLDSFYHSFRDMKKRRLDGLIITGAPVETLEYNEVDYWDELCEAMEWSKTHVFSTLHICWGAQAALFYHYGIEKHEIGHKLTGVFPHDVLIPQSRLMRGFDAEFYAPHSRFTTVREEDISAAGIEILSNSREAGVYIAANKGRRQVFVTGHSEYDLMTLDEEYRRDLEKGLDIKPVNYYKDDDPGKPPVSRWRAHAHLLFSNWLNYYVYQETPYNIAAIK